MIRHKVSSLQNDGQQKFIKNFEGSEEMDEKKTAGEKQGDLFTRLRTVFRRIARALGGGDK